MRPLARWTVGYCTDAGIEATRLSVRRFKRLHPEFDRVICCNNLTDGQIRKLKLLGERMHIQSEDESCVPLTPHDWERGWKDSMPGWGWKLVPPRLRPEAHELWIDNDIIFNRRIEFLKEWISTDKAIISSSHRTVYGSFELPEDYPPVCAGFFGLPPGFDFEKEIVKRCFHLETLGYYDEQGLVASIVQSQDHTILPMSELMIVKEMNFPLPPAMHFIGVNRSKRHSRWDMFKRWVIKC